MDEVLNTAIFVERRSDAHSRGKYHVGFTKIARDEADVLKLFPRRARYPRQM